MPKEIDSEQNRLLLQAKQNYVVARTNEDQTTAALEAQKSDAYKLRDDLVEYTLRQREFESNRTCTTGLLQRLRTASVQAGLESLEIDVVDQALPPAAPVLRPQSTIILTTLVFGVLAGIIVAFLMESLDTGLRSVAEIESITELPSLAIIPRARRSSADQAGTLTTAATEYQLLDAAEVAVRGSLPLAAHVASAVDSRTSSEDSSCLRARRRRKARRRPRAIWLRFWRSEIRGFC